MVRHATDVLQIPVPYTVVVFFFGVVVGYLPVSQIVTLGPHTILYVFMPILIFEGAFAIDVYVFKQIILNVLILAGPGLVVMIMLTAVLSMYLFKYPQWDWVIALLFGSILTATDPVAVVAIMKELGTSKRLALLIEGESMLNDGTAMVFYEIFLHMMETHEFSISSTLLYIVWISIGGSVFGYIMAKLAIFWLQWTFNDTLTEIAITLSVAYLVFYIADAYLKVSAVLGVVAMGVTLSEHRTSISPEVEMFLHSFWETLAFMANTLIFHICGFIISRFVIMEAELQDWIYLIILYFGLQVIRGVTIWMFSPFLKRLGYGLTWQDGLVTAWSGLRGAIGLALSLITFQHHSPILSTPDVGGKILFHVSAIVVLTLLINATTMSNLLTFLGLTDVTPARRNAMKKAVKILDENRIKSMNVWRIDRFLADADWEVVDHICTVEDPFMSTETTEEKELRERQGGICPQCHIVVPYVPTQSEVRNMLAEATRKYLKLLKQNFWLQFEKGLLTGFSVRKLIEMADEAADRDGEMINVAEIKRMWRVPRNLGVIQNIITSQCVLFPIDYNKEGSMTFMVSVMMCESPFLMVAVFGMDSFIIILTVLTFISGDYHFWTPGANMLYGLENSSILLTFVCFIYYIFRIIMFRLIYIKTFWFFLNTLCITCGMWEAFDHFEHLWTKEDLDHLHAHSRLVTFAIVFMSIFRSMQICEFGAIVVLDVIKQKLRARLTKGCDLARGFVRANEVAIRLVENISDDVYVQTKIKNNADMATLTVLRELGLLQGLHPDVALGVKTYQAIRSVLNVLREGMHHLIEEGGIDEPEGLLFIKVIESKMKRVMASPPQLLIPSPKKILESIPWVEGNQFLVEFILGLAEKRLYHYGDTIMKIGEMPDGIHVIVSGLVKVEVPLETDKSDSSSLRAVRLMDFLSTGNVIGEKSVLLETPRGATLTCETIVQTMYLSTKNLKLTFQMFAFLDPPLSVRMWKVVAMKIAMSILSNMPSYRGLRQDNLQARLDSAELEYMNISNTFEVTSQMVDVILIVGKAIDKRTKETYTGPCYIPKSVAELVFAPGQSPVPLILYTEKTIVSLQGARLSFCITDKSKSIYNLEFPSSPSSNIDNLRF